MFHTNKIHTNTGDDEIKDLVVANIGKVVSSTAHRPTYK